MAINRDSNVYTIVFATIMVVIVGGLLAFIASSLKPIQKANTTNEKMQNILQAIGLEEMRELQRDEAGTIFNDYVKRRITINFKGEILSDKTAADAIDPLDKLDAFNIDLRKEYSRFVKPIMNQNKGNDEAIKAALMASEDIHFPIFVCENEGETIYVLSASGKGLWDDIWGYIGLSSDLKTINGTVFDHKQETAGLGSKINEAWFEDQFVGKTIEEDGMFIPIEVKKPGNDLNNHQIDGISGATFTGVGVDEMLGRSMEVYYDFLKNNSDFSANASTTEALTEENNTVVASENDSTHIGYVSSIPFTGEFNADFDLMIANYDSLVVGDTKSMIITGIKFSAGSANINKKSSTETLDHIVEGLNTMEDVHIELSGHTDNAGEEEVLLSLSKNRAEAVKTYLVEAGIDETRIVTAGYGSSKAIASNDTQEGKDQNKRTEIKIIK